MDETVQGPYRPDRRANRLLAWQEDHSHERTRLWLRAADDVVRHIEAVCQGARRRPVPGDLRPVWTHLLETPVPLGPATRDMLRLLGDVLVVPPPSGVRGVVALDFYKRVAGDELLDTTVGRLIRLIKYSSVSQEEQATAGQVLTGGLLTVLGSHGWLRSATHIVAPPAHDRLSPSLGEWLAAATADCAGKTRVRCVGRSEYRKSAKDMTEAERDGLTTEFRLDQSVSGATVLVIDDVIHHGSTMGAVAQAARRGGAASVLGLVVARNFRH